MASRREFLASVAAAGMYALRDGRPASGGTMEEARIVGRRAPPGSLRILILGGTAFLGPHQVAYAMGRGHSVSTFTRGRTVPDVHRALFDQVEQLVGDRAGDLGALRSRSWDVVIDNSGRRAEWTRESARLLRDRAELYVYTSSTGVYYPYLRADIREDAELVLSVPAEIDEVQSIEYGYGVMKATSEIEARRAFGDDRVTVVRPTYMMGPGDRTDRFTYWPVRLARGGDVLVPGRPDDPVQYLDVRDVAAWMIRMAEAGTTGTYNAVGPASRTGMVQFVHGAHAAFASEANFESITDYDFLARHEVLDAVPWIMPTGDNFGSALVGNEKGVAQGLTFRPLAERVRDIHEWWQSDAVSTERREAMVSGAGSLMAREGAFLAAWRARR